MELVLDPDLESAVKAEAQQTGVTPEQVVINALKRRFLKRPELPVPRDDWERDILSLGVDCGVSLSNEAVSSEGIYE